LYDPIAGCDDTPVIEITPKPGPKACVASGENIVMSIELSDTTVCVAGGQFRLEYDPSCLDFVSAAGSGVWTNLIHLQVNESTGVIEIAVGAKIAPGAPKCDDGGNMADITFTKIGKCNECQICPVDLNPLYNMLTDDKGLELDFPLVCSDVIHDDRQDELNCPEDLAVNADCGATTASVSWDSVHGFEQCDGPYDLRCECSYQPILQCRVGASNKIGEVCQGGQEGDACVVCIGQPPNQICYDGTCQNKWPASQVNCADYVDHGGDMPQGRYSFTCYNEQNDDHTCVDADKPSCTWTVQVSDHQSLDVKVELSPVVVNGQFTRCICFEGFSSCSPEVMEETCVDVTFGGPGNFAGQSDDTVKIKKGKYVCLTARDRQHSLRATDFLSCGADHHWDAEFKGDPFFGGNWLIQGNLNRDNVINILDFGVFLGQLNQNPNPNKNKYCDDNDGFGYTHADLNGDANVDVADFTFIQINFLETDKNSCCPDSAAAEEFELLTEISVKELRERGLGELAVADLNNDGLVNTEDMAAYLAGARPKAAVKAERGDGRVGLLRK
jgi:hypothetical protein